MPGKIAALKTGKRHRGCSAPAQLLLNDGSLQSMALSSGMHILGLLALFDFFDALGSSSAQDGAGTPENATFFGNATTDGAGHAVFDGDGDYAVIDPDPAFDLSQGTIEVSFTLNSTSPGGAPWGGSAAYTVFSSDATGVTEGHINIFVNNFGDIVVRHQTDTSEHYYTGGKAVVGSEVDVSYSFGPSGSILVVDGVTVDTGTQAHTVIGGTNPIVIGASTASSPTGSVGTPAGSVDGTISRVAIYDDQIGSRGAPACLMAETRLETPVGLRPAGGLRAGDEVLTLDHGAVSIVCIFHQTIRQQHLTEQPSARPIKIAAGALGNTCSFGVSRQHCLLMRCDGREVLVRAGHLADFGHGRFRRADGVRSVTYVHLLLPRHALIRAEGCWVESLLPGSSAVPSRRRCSSGFERSEPCRPILTGRQVRQALYQGRLGITSPMPLVS